MIAESRETPMHVGGLQLFDPPAGVPADDLTALYEQAVSVRQVTPLFRKRAVRSALALGQWTWQDDGEVDLEHHVRHSGLARPGRFRELFALVSRLHGTLLDRSRPLWEAHLIEGLDNGQFAVYTKLHHALMDGVSSLRLLQRSLSTDPDERDVPLPWARPAARRRGGGSDLLRVPRGAVGLAGDALGLTPRLLRIAEDVVRGQAATLPVEAPRSLFNVPISGSRRFAADGWSLERVRRVGRAAEATVNDVVLAMCSGALRAYLLEQGALPSSSLVAMTPVSLRKGDDDGAAGDEGSNAVGTILCRLGTELTDAEARLLTVRASMNAGKRTLRGLSQNQVTALSTAVMAPMLFSYLPGATRIVPPPFNLVISNVPGPTSPLYWNGARLSGMYPLSIPTHGQAMNITVTSYVEELQFGIVGDRRSVPHLQRLLGHLEEALQDLEKSFL